VLAEVGPQQDAESFEHLVAHPVSVFPVDGRQPIDVEEDQRNREAIAARAIDLFRQNGVEELTGI
jgi:hypothetical protein